MSAPVELFSAILRRKAFSHVARPFPRKTGMREGSEAMEMLEELMEILACPRCKGPLRETEDALVCTACRLKYPIRNGIPVLLVDEAESTDGE